MDINIHKRIELATPTELNRLCKHLGMKQGVSRKKILKAYFVAAEHAISTATRPVLNNELPIYSDVLKRIYKEMRSYAEAYDDTFQQVKALIRGGYQSPIEKMTDSELEGQIWEMYIAAKKDTLRELRVGPEWRRKIFELFVTIGGTSLATFLLTRLPLVGTGPMGIALGILLLGTHMIGPAYRKLIPATIELSLIAKRINNMPQEEEV